MPNPEWGVKRLCPNCATRFYDLTNDPATCPSCEMEFPLHALSLKRVKAERNVAAAEKKVAEPVPEEKEAEDEDVIDEVDVDIDVDVEDDVLDDSDDDEVSLEEIGDVATGDEET